MKGSERVNQMSVLSVNALKGCFVCIERSFGSRLQSMRRRLNTRLQKVFVQYVRSEDRTRQTDHLR